MSNQTFSRSKALNSIPEKKLLEFINDINTTTPDLQIYIDRNEYTNSGIITVDITPF